MNKKVKFFGAILSGLLAASAAWAQTGPSGPYQLTVGDASNLVWDLAVIEPLRDVSIEVSPSNSGGWVNIHFVATPVRASGGKVAGAGTSTVTLEYEPESGGTATKTFTGTYKLSGSISSSKSIAKGSFSGTVSGTINDFEGATRNVKATGSTSFAIDNATKTVSGNNKASASASGLGSISSKDTFGPQDLDDPDLGNGNWTLDMTLATSGKVVTASVAKVTLSSGLVLPFTAKGTYTAKTQSTKIVFTGTGVAKGTSLQIGMIGDQVKTVKGKLLGQSVNVVR